MHRADPAGERGLKEKRASTVTVSLPKMLIRRSSDSSSGESIYCDAYLGRRGDAGIASISVRPDVAARFVLETATWWARHRHRDPEPLAIDDAARDAVVKLVMHTLAP